jgi:hypothetical protein
MRKLKLELDNLSVESFDTTATQKKKGTVFGEQCTCWTYCAQQTCPGCPTCDNTCAYTCDDATCVYTCDDNTCPYTCDDNTCVYTCNESACYGTCNRTCLASCNGAYSCRC